MLPLGERLAVVVQRGFARLFDRPIEGAIEGVRRLPCIRICACAPTPSLSRLARCHGDSYPTLPSLRRASGGRRAA